MIFKMRPKIYQTNISMHWTNVMILEFFFLKIYFLQCVELRKYSFSNNLVLHMKFKNKNDRY